MADENEIKPVALMMEAVSISRMLVNFFQFTWRNNPEGSQLLAVLRADITSNSWKGIKEISGAWTFMPGYVSGTF